MTNEQILKKCIKKAVEGGYYLPIFNQDAYKEFINDYQVEHILFDHSFAKAFWGEERYECPDCGSNKIKIYPEGYFPYWCESCGAKCGCDWGWEMEYKHKSIIEHKGRRYHISELAKSTDRLKYMEQFIK